MFQNFETQGDRAAGPARLKALRAEMARVGADGFLIPRGDAHMGETVAPRDQRLLWLTGFTGTQIPYDALGMELTPDYHQKSRLFGVNTAMQARRTPCTPSAAVGAPAPRCRPPPPQFAGCLFLIAIAMGTRKLQEVPVV